jgi:hypothetical protein
MSDAEATVESTLAIEKLISDLATSTATTSQQESMLGTHSRHSKII